MAGRDATRSGLNCDSPSVLYDDLFGRCAFVYTDAVAKAEVRESVDQFAIFHLTVIREEQALPNRGSDQWFSPYSLFRR
jgi:hypothetical protein